MLFAFHLCMLEAAVVVLFVSSPAPVFPEVTLGSRYSHVNDKWNKIISFGGLFFRENVT